MSAIPIYTQSPINAAIANGATSKTAVAQAPQDTTATLGTDDATTTTMVSSTSSNLPAKPGAPAIPMPTAAVQKYIPSQPILAVKTGPPAPQPGAFPALKGKRSHPPPPKAGKTFQPPQTAVPRTSMSQMSMPSPTALGCQPPSSFTSTTTTSSLAYPISPPPTEPGGRRQSLEHPPGYVQNVYASEPSADQRRAKDTQNISGIGTYGYNTTSLAVFDADHESVWNTAKGWASAAGKKLSYVESEVWKRVNGER